MYDRDIIEYGYTSSTEVNLLGKPAQVPGVMLWICPLTSKTEDFGESYGPNGMKIYKHQINWIVP